MKNKTRFIALFCLISLVFANPLISYITPTEDNNAYISTNYTYINLTSTENLQQALVEWGNSSGYTNISMTNSSLTNWHLNITNIIDDSCNYTIYAYNTSGIWKKDELKLITIDTTNPTISIHTPIENNYYSDSTALELNWSNDEVLSEAVYSFNGGNNVSILKWNRDESMESGLLCDVCDDNPFVFLYDGNWYLICFKYNSAFYGYNWTGSAWQSDTAIVSGLAKTQSMHFIDIFSKDNNLYAICGNSGGTFTGYNWTGSAWQSDTAIVSGLEDIGSYSMPTIYKKGSAWYLIASAVENYHDIFYGYNWTGTAWQSDTAIVSGLAELNNKGDRFNVEVFEKNNDFFLIATEYYTRFYGYKWNGTDWENYNNTASGLIKSGGITPMISSCKIFKKEGVLYAVINDNPQYPNFFNLSSTNWQRNDNIVEGLITLPYEDIGRFITPNVFNITILRLIAGKGDGTFTGYNWTGTAWQSDTAIVSGLVSCSNYADPTIFKKNSIWYLISGCYDGSKGYFNGYNWTGTAWQSDTAIVSGLSNVSGSAVHPHVFEKNNVWYLIHGNFAGTFTGYNWTGTAWQSDTAIVSGLGDIGARSTPHVFEKNSIWYLIAGEEDGTLNGFKWNGTSWNNYGYIADKINKHYSDSSITTFTYNQNLYAIIGDRSWDSYELSFYGHKWIADIDMIEGENNITIYSKDQSSNTGTKTITFTLDTILPYVEIYSPSNTTYDAITIDLNYTSSDTNLDTTWYEYNSTNTTLTTNTTFTALEDQISTLTLYVNDTAGNINHTSVAFTVMASPRISNNLTNNAHEDQDLQLNITITDLNIDTVILTFNNTNYTVTTNISDEYYYTIAKSNYTAHDTIEYIWYANDTIGQSNSSTYNITIANQIPAVSSPELNDTIPKTNDILNCTGGTFSDNDAEDTETSRQYQWYDNDSLISGQTSQTLDLSVANLDKNNVIKCAVSVYDGYDYSTYTNSSNNATIQNTAPTTPTTLTPVTGKYGGSKDTIDLICSGTTDADNDIINYSIDVYNGSWNNIDFEGDGLYSLNISSYADQFIDFRCNATDSTNTTAYYNPSGTIEIDNSGLILIYVSPTPDNNTYQQKHNVYVNLTIEEPNLDTALLLWNDEINYTMSCDGSTPHICHYNVTGLTTTNYNFSVWANNTVGTIDTESTRYINIYDETLTYSNRTPYNNTINITHPSELFDITAYTNLTIQVNGTAKNTLTYNINLSVNNIKVYYNNGTENTDTTTTNDSVTWTYEETNKTITNLIYYTLNNTLNATYTAEGTELNTSTDNYQWNVTLILNMTQSFNPNLNWTFNISNANHTDNTGCFDTTTNATYYIPTNTTKVIYTDTLIEDSDTKYEKQTEIGTYLLDAEFKALYYKNIYHNLTVKQFNVWT